MRLRPSLCALWLPVLLLAGILTYDAQAQSASVRGFVSDRVTEEALQGASVALRGGGELFGTITDGDGYFLLTRIPPGRYTLRISFVGYVAFEDTLELEPGAVVQRTTALALREEELEEVVVEAEIEGGVTAVAAGLETVTPADIQRAPVPGTTGDLAGYLQTVPGVTLPGDRGGQFFVRGGALDQNLALIDGLPVYMPFHVLSFYSAFPDEIIDQADVYTGGFGARYGTRISSIVDVRARNGNKQRPAGSLSVAPFLSTVRLEGPLVRDRVSFIGSARYSLIEKVFPTLLGQDLPYRFGDLFGKVHAYVNPHHAISALALHTDDRGSVAGTKKTFEGNFEASAPDDSSEAAWANTVFGGTYTYRSGRLPLLAEITGGYSEMVNEFGPREARPRRSSIESVDLAAHLTYFLRGGRLTAGVSRRASTLAYALGGQFQGVPESAEHEVTEVDAYLEADLLLRGGAVQVRPGLHLYALPDRSRQWLDPRLRLTWRPGRLPEGTQFHAAWGLYHQVLTGLNDERDLGNLFTAWVPALDDASAPESMHAFAGLSAPVRPGVSVAVEAFFKEFRHLSVPAFRPVPSFTTALQPADGRAVGFDVRIDLQDLPFQYGSVFDGYLSYGLSQVEYETGDLTYPPAHDRRHQVNALLHAQRDELGVTLQIQYGTGLPFTQSAGFDVWLLPTPGVDVASAPGQERILYAEPFGGRLPDYQRVDLWLERRVERGRTRYTLRGGVINVLNRDNLFYYDLFEFRRVDQLPFTPSIGFKAELR